jgi:hypothetical protein
MLRPDQFPWAASTVYLEKERSDDTEKSDGKDAIGCTKED